MDDMEYKALKKDGSGWVYGYHVIMMCKKTWQRGDYIIDSAGLKQKAREVIPGSIRRATRLKDREGKMIYEKDILDLESDAYRRRFGYPVVNIGDYVDENYCYIDYEGDRYDADHPAAYGVYIKTKNQCTGLSAETAQNFKIIGSEDYIPEGKEKENENGKEAIDAGK